MATNQKTKIARALKALDDRNLATVREILNELIGPVAVKPRGIEHLTIAIDGPGCLRRFNPDDPKALKAAETTLCVLCSKPLRMARLSGWGGKSCPGIQAGYTHAGCTAAARAEVDRIFAELDANRVQIEFDRKAAEYCACGHHGTVDHARDEMENLLKCNVKGCDCDHFRMSTTPAPYDEAGYQAANPDAAGCDPTCAACENGEHGGCDCPCTETGTHVGNQDVTITAADRVAMENLNADIEEASARELGLSADQFD
jgi:hypothetical protein